MVKVHCQLPIRSYSFGGPKLSITGGTGPGFEFGINVTGTTYSFQNRSNGTGYTTADTIVCAGNLMGGATANDLYLRVVAVDGAGGIIDVRVEGSDESSVPRCI